MDIKLAKTNIKKLVGGSLLTSILTLGRTLVPILGKTLGLWALAGLASEGAGRLVKTISGRQIGGFLIPNSKNDRKCKNKAGRKMVPDNMLYNERQWGHWLARDMITKRKLGLGVDSKNVKRHLAKKK